MASVSRTLHKKYITKMKRPGHLLMLVLALNIQSDVCSRTYLHQNVSGFKE